MTTAAVRPRRSRLARPAVLLPLAIGLALLAVYAILGIGLAAADRPARGLGRRAESRRDHQPGVLVQRYEARLRAVHVALGERGYNAGPVDAVMGPRTAEALRSFQRRQGLQITGRPDAATVSALGLER
jgi:peptidoglycan hydrolase-like protein with peptidoglycan-binding domain